MKNEKLDNQLAWNIGFAGTHTKTVLSNSVTVLLDGDSKNKSVKLSNAEPNQATGEVINVFACMHTHTFRSWTCLGN